MANATVKRVSTDSLTGRQKSAILLMQVGDEAVATIMEQLGPDEVEAISFEIAKMDT